METKRRLIEKALTKARWSPVAEHIEGSRIETGAVKEHPTDHGPADYVLFHRGEALAIVEAKKLIKGPQSAIEQAKRYARGYKGGRFDSYGYGVPFIYSTNGSDLSRDIYIKSIDPCFCLSFRKPFALI